MKISFNYVPNNKCTYYGVYLNDIEKQSINSDVLRKVRKDFFETDQKQKGNMTTVSDNEQNHFSYVMSEGAPLKWKKTRARMIMEKSQVTKDGYEVIVYDENELMLKTVSFDRDHNWIQTKYYGKNGKPPLIIRPITNKSIAVLEIESENGKTLSLYPVRIPTDAAISEELEKKVSIVATVYTSGGLALFTTKDNVVKWENYVKRLQEDSSKSDVDTENGFEVAYSGFSDLRPAGSVFDITKTRAVFGRPRPQNISQEMPAADSARQYSQLGSQPAQQNRRPTAHDANWNANNNYGEVSDRGFENDFSHQAPAQSHEVIRQTRPQQPAEPYASQHIHQQPQQVQRQATPIQQPVPTHPPVPQQPQHTPQAPQGQPDENMPDEYYAIVERIRQAFKEGGKIPKHDPNQTSSGVAGVINQTVSRPAAQTPAQQPSTNGRDIRRTTSDDVDFDINKFLDTYETKKANIKFTPETEDQPQPQKAEQQKPQAADPVREQEVKPEEPVKTQPALQESEPEPEEVPTTPTQEEAPKKQSIGRLYRNDKCVYIGSFIENRKNGYGIEYNENGDEIYNGLWKSDKYHGPGMFIDVKNSLVIISVYIDGLPQGKTTIVKNGKILREGLCENGRLTYVREFSEDGKSVVYEGQIDTRGNKNGMGCEFTILGKKKNEGLFEKNVFLKKMPFVQKKLDDLPYEIMLADSDYEKYRRSVSFVIDRPYDGGLYTGMTKDGIPHGRGTIVYNDSVVSGEFTNGK